MSVKRTICDIPTVAVGQRESSALLDKEMIQFKMEEVNHQKFTQRKESSFYKEQRKQVYLLLERPQTKLAMAYHLTSFILILGSLVLSVLATIEQYEKHSTLKNLMLAYELTLLAIFIVEFLLRIWSCGYVSRYKGLSGRIRFMKSFYMIVDAFVILSTTITAILQINAAYFTILRITRFMQILRILRIDRQRGDLRLMINVVRQHSKELFTCYFVGFIILFAGTYIVYVLEKFANLEKDEIKITNMADGLYWAIVTVTSVGYGDFSPVSWQGKFATGLFALTGCAFFALPAGILGSGFALQVDKQKKEQRYMKVRNPAARLLQTVYRNHALKSDNIGPTWYYMLPQLKASYSATKSTNGIPSLKTMVRGEFYRTQKVEVVPYNPHIAANEIAPESAKVLDSYINSQSNANSTLASKTSGHLKLKRDAVQVLKREELLKQNVEKKTEEEVSKVNVRTSKKKRSQISKQHSIAGDKTLDVHLKYKIAVRFLMKVKFWIAVKGFKHVRHPFINVQDLMERTAQSHTDLLAHIKDMREAFDHFQTEFESMRKIVMRQRNTTSIVEEDDEEEDDEMNSNQSGSCDITDMKMYANDDR